MNKLTKGSIAAAAAGVLLLGGIGTLAFWTDSEIIDGGSVTAGTLSLGPPTCDEAWVYAVDNAGVGDAVALIVPGDTITKDCTFVVNATGDNLEATLTIPDSAEFILTPAGDTDAESFEATVAATYVSDGAAINSTITEANDGDIVTATINVAFPFGDETTINANDMQSVEAQLNEIPITLTQTES